jgi:ATP-dependent Clp protease adaptor protein ClpS
MGTNLLAFCVDLMLDVLFVVVEAEPGAMRTMTENTLPPPAQPGADPQLHHLMRPASEDLVRVVLHNDEVTPYDYVIEMLGSLFLVSEELADHIAWTAHNQGSAVVVVRPRGEAEKLAKVGCGRAKLDGFPLSFTLEQE